MIPFDQPPEDDAIEVGDEVTWTPHEKERRYQSSVTGYVAGTVQGATGDSGYEVMVPDEERGGHNTIRLWSSRGTFEKTGKTADWKRKPEPAPSAAPPSQSEPEHRLPYRNAADLAADYKAKGMDKQAAWRQYVLDTIMMPRYRSEQMDAREFFSVYDRVS